MFTSLAWPFQVILSQLLAAMTPCWQYLNIEEFLKTTCFLVMMKSGNEDNGNKFQGLIELECFQIIVFIS